MKERGTLGPAFAGRLDEKREVSVCVLHARPAQSDKRAAAPRPLDISLPETCLGSARAVKPPASKREFRPSSAASPWHDARMDDVDRERPERRAGISYAIARLQQLVLGAVSEVAARHGLTALSSRP
jgi:hypothetical protein